MFGKGLTGRYGTAFQLKVVHALLSIRSPSASPLGPPICWWYGTFLAVPRFCGEPFHVRARSSHWHGHLPTTELLRSPMVDSYASGTQQRVSRKDFLNSSSP